MSLGCGKRLTVRRHQAIPLLQEGRATREVAQLLAVDPRSVRCWKGVDREQGAMDWRPHPVHGCPLKLNMHQRAVGGYSAMRGCGEWLRSAALFHPP
jgi:transposase